MQPNNNKCKFNNLNDKNILNLLYKTKAYKSIHPIIQQAFQKIFLCYNQIYGRYIQWDKVFKILDGTSIHLCDFGDTDLFGGFEVFVGSSKDLNKFDCYNIDIDKNANGFEAITTLAHELSHLFSLNIKKTGIMLENNTEQLVLGFYESTESHLTGEQLYERGEAINEGMADFIAKTVIYHYYNNPIKSRIAMVAYDAISDNVYNWLSEKAELLYYIMGDKLLYSFFRGNPKTPQNEFDRLVEQGSWNTYISILDKINSTDFCFENQVDQLKKESDVILLEYCSQRTKIGRGYSNNIMLKDIIKEMNLEKSNNLYNKQYPQNKDLLNINELYKNLSLKSSHELIDMLVT